MVVGRRLALLRPHSFVAIAAALSVGLGAPASAQSAKAQVIPLSPDDEEAIIVPAGSPMQLASAAAEYSNTKFRGQFTLSGAYEIVGYGNDASVTIWPDRKSLEKLPYWRLRGGPDELYLSNPWAFAQAVVGKDKLNKLKNGKLESVRGRVTIIADDYETSIECDAANFSARYVSLVKAMQIAALPKTEESC